MCEWPGGVALHTAQHDCSMCPVLHMTRWFKTCHNCRHTGATILRFTHPTNAFLSPRHIPAMPRNRILSGCFPDLHLVNPMIYPKNKPCLPLQTCNPPAKHQTPTPMQHAPQMHSMCLHLFILGSVPFGSLHMVQCPQPIVTMNARMFSEGGTIRAFPPSVKGMMTLPPSPR